MPAVTAVTIEGVLEVIHALSNMTLWITFNIFLQYFFHFLGHHLVLWKDEAYT